MRRNISFYGVSYWHDWRRILQCCHDSRLYLFNVTFLWTFIFLLAWSMMMPYFNILKIPHNNLSIDGSSNHNSWIFRVKLKSENFKWRNQNQKWINSMHILIIPEENCRFWWLHWKYHSFIERKILNKRFSYDRVFCLVNSNPGLKLNAWDFFILAWQIKQIFRLFYYIWNFCILFTAFLAFWKHVEIILEDI